MIEKMLNKYYSNKLIQKIDSFIIPYFVDLKFVQDKKYRCLFIYIKKPKYNDKEYCLVKKIYCDDYIRYLAYPKELYKDIIKGVDKYCKECYG